MDALAALIEKARTEGWASTDETSFETLTRLATGPLRTARNRESGPTIDVLKPTATDKAHQRSLSAMVGTREQPLHTDGAHHIDPPDYIMMSCPHGSNVPTWLWRFDWHASSGRPTQDLLNGLFTVRTGKASFLSHPLTAGTTQLRYDPGCMSPADARAQRAADYLESRRTEATPFNWDKPGLVLMIANSRVLHCRGDASSEPNREMLRTALRVTLAPPIQRPAQRAMP